MVLRPVGLKPQARPHGERDEGREMDGEGERRGEEWSERCLSGAVLNVPPPPLKHRKSMRRPRLRQYLMPLP